MFGGRINKKAQATLEFTLMLIITVALIAGFTRLAKWVEGHIGDRQKQYEDTRLMAGKRKSPGAGEKYLASLFDEDDIYYFDR